MRRTFLFVALVAMAAIVGTILGAERKFATLVEHSALLAKPAQPVGELVMGGIDLETALRGLWEVSPDRSPAARGSINRADAPKTTTAAEPSAATVPQPVARSRVELLPGGQGRVFRFIPEKMLGGEELGPHVQITPMAPGSRTVVRILVRVPLATSGSGGGDD